MIEHRSRADARGRVRVSQGLVSRNGKLGFILPVRVQFEHGAVGRFPIQEDAPKIAMTDGFRPIKRAIRELAFDNGYAWDPRAQRYATIVAARPSAPVRAVGAPKR